MMHVATVQSSANLLAQLAAPAFRTLFLAAGAGLALTVFGVRATSARLFTWSAVLYAALAMPLLGWILPPLSVPIPAFFEEGAARSMVQPHAAAEVRSARKDESIAFSKSREIEVSARASGQAAAFSLAPSAPIRPLSPRIDWTSIRLSTIAGGMYIAVALFLLTRFFVGLVLSRRLIHAAQPICDPRLKFRLASRVRYYGARLELQAAESELISVPITVGISRPAILLPADWRQWDDAKLHAVLAHEVSHVVRRDALTQRLSLLHRAIFWFSPLAWWLDRHLTELAEQASDEAALSCGADRNEYAKTLLGFFESVHAAPGRVWWQGVAMAKAGQAEQRLERILSWKGAVTMGLKKSFAVAIVAFAVPAVYLAASVRPAHSTGRAEFTQAQTAPPAAPVTGTPATPPSPAGAPDAAFAPASPPSSMTPPAAVAPIGGVVSKNGYALIRPPSPVVPIAPIPPVAPLAPQSTRHSSRGYSYHYGYDDEQRFVIVSGKSENFTMSGTGEDAHHVEKLRKQMPGDFIWFQRDEKSYIIRDQATIDRARKLWAPQEELGRKQEELGKRQEELGEQQDALGKKMEQVQVQVPDLTTELDKLKAEMKQLGPKATQEQLGRIQSEIGDLQSRIGEIQSQAGEQQGKLGEEMGALGEKQGKLGEQQGELGRQQGELAEQASRQMKELLDEAIKKGTAQPEPQSGGGAL